MCARGAMSGSCGPLIWATRAPAGARTAEAWSASHATAVRLAVLIFKVFTIRLSLLLILFVMSGPASVDVGGRDGTVPVWAPRVPRVGSGGGNRPTHNPVATYVARNVMREVWASVS